MKDYKISELIDLCLTHRKCGSCPAVEFCDLIEQTQCPEHWELDLESEKKETTSSVAHIDA